jgi:hypothetical protein
VTLAVARRPAVAPRRVARGFGALVLSVVVVLAACLLVVALDESEPSPGRVLAAAQSYVRSQRSVAYSAAESISTPGGPQAAEVIRSRTVTGGDRFGAANDFTVTVGSLVFEYRAVAARSGVWVRVASPPDVLDSANWVHAVNYAAFETFALEAQGDPAPDPTDVGEAVLADTVSDGDILPLLLRAARSPSRVGSSVRTLDVTFDPTLLVPGISVDSITGVLTVDAHDRPTRIVLDLHSGPRLVSVDYSPRWGATVNVVPPAPADVTASY